MITAWFAWMGLAMAADWRLVAAYDAAALGAGEPEAGSYLWQPASGMVNSCGEAKHPEGLGVFEAEAVSGGLTPTLVLVLEHAADVEPVLGPEDVRVAIGLGEARVLLQPMVDTRHLAFYVHGEAWDPENGADPTARYQQVVRTQLAVETCMEHKTGRGWVGGDAPRLRQAFLLDAPGALDDPTCHPEGVGFSRGDPSRRYFGGQQDPVPAMMGPPDACLSTSAPAGNLAASGRGEGSLSLVATDVWGASLRSCTTVELRGDPVLDASEPMPLRMYGEAGPWRPRRPHWSGIDVALRLDEGMADRDLRVHVTMSALAPARPGQEPELLQPPLYEGPLFREQPSGEPGVVDLLAHIPHTYPRTGPENNPSRYTVLMIPNWQIVEALRRLERGGSVACPLVTSPDAVIDGVGTVLAHPELLLLQTKPEDAGTIWPNLASGMRGRLTRGAFGLTVGMEESRSPISLPSITPPTWVQNMQAQRNVEHAVLIISLFAGLIVLWLGLRRVRDLWTRVPMERASYWPGPGDLVLSESQTAEAQTAAALKGHEEDG